MIEIKDLLIHIEALLFKEDEKKRCIRKVLLETIGLDINTKNIKIKNNTIYLDVKPIYKNEILLKKEEISSKLKQIFLKNPPKDFR